MCVCVCVCVYDVIEYLLVMCLSLYTHTPTHARARAHTHTHTQPNFHASSSSLCRRAKLSMHGALNGIELVPEVTSIASSWASSCTQGCLHGLALNSTELAPEDTSIAQGPLVRGRVRAPKAVVFDTDVLSCLFKDDTRVSALRRALEIDARKCTVSKKHKNTPLQRLISFQTQAELYSWILQKNMREERINKLEALLTSCHVMYPDQRTCVIWAYLMMSCRAVCTHRRIYTHTHTYTYITYVYIYIRMYIHTYIQSYVLRTEWVD